MPEKDWELKKLRPDVADELLEQKFGRLSADLVEKLNKTIVEAQAIIMLFPTVETRFRAFISSFVGMMYPLNRRECLTILESATKYVEEHVKEEE